MSCVESSEKKISVYFISCIYSSSKKMETRLRSKGTYVSNLCPSLDVVLAAIIGVRSYNHHHKIPMSLPLSACFSEIVLGTCNLQDGTH